LTIKFLKDSSYIEKINSDSIEDKKYIKRINNKIELHLNYLLNPFIKNSFNNLVNYWKKPNPDSANYCKKEFKELYK